MAKQDLVDFEMDTNLSSMKNLSEWAFKNQLSKKADALNVCSQTHL